MQTPMPSKYLYGVVLPNISAANEGLCKLLKFKLSILLPIAALWDKSDKVEQLNLIALPEQVSYGAQMGTRSVCNQGAHWVGAASQYSART